MRYFKGKGRWTRCPRCKGTGQARGPIWGTVECRDCEGGLTPVPDSEFEALKAVAPWRTEGLEDKPGFILT